MFPDGRRFVSASADETLKVWDINMDSRPVKTIPIHDHLRPKLADLYENDCIFDKFECSWGRDSKHVCSGTYDNKLQVWDAFTTCDSSITPSRI